MKKYTQSVGVIYNGGIVCSEQLACASRHRLNLYIEGYRKKSHINPQEHFP
jgi:hypothetical protein